MTAPRPTFNLLDRFIRQLRLRRLGAFLEPQMRVLDFGCGESNWFLTSNARNIRSGIGIDPYAAPTTDCGSIESFRGPLDTFYAHHPDARFDLITWIAVVEHLEPADARAALHRCRTMLAPGGTIVLTTPTPRAKPILELLARLKVISRVEIDDHKLYYARPSMTSLLADAGLAIQQYSTFQFGLNSLTVAKESGRI